MIEYLVASKNDKEEIIDLINYVFSYDYNPHNFKKFLPKVYSDKIDGLGAKHYIVKENGNIKAVVAIRIIDISYYGLTLKVGVVGSVAVHPYSRGNGYMSKLLEFATDDAKKIGIQILMLSGKRQRYGYFGFENGGIVYKFSLSSANIKHALADVDDSNITYRELTNEMCDEIKFACKLHNEKTCHVIRTEDEFYNILCSWSNKPYAIYKDGRMIGYSFGILGEVSLVDESDYPAVVKAMFKGLKSTNIPVASYEKEKIEFLSSICEDYTIAHNEKVCVLDWKSVLEVLLKLKSKITELTSGEMSFNIDGECINISVKNNEVTVSDSNILETTKVLSHNEAERMFFELNGFLSNKLNNNWFPLPLYIDNADTF